VTPVANAPLLVPGCPARCARTATSSAQAFPVAWTSRRPRCRCVDEGLVERISSPQRRWVVARVTPTGTTLPALAPVPSVVANLAALHDHLTAAARIVERLHSAERRGVRFTL